MLSVPDRVMKLLYSLPHEIEQGRVPRWTETTIRVAVELVMKEDEKHE